MLRKIASVLLCFELTYGPTRYSCRSDLNIHSWRQVSKIVDLASNSMFDASWHNAGGQEAGSNSYERAIKFNNELEMQLSISLLTRKHQPTHS